MSVLLFFGVASFIVDNSLTSLFVVFFSCLRWVHMEVRVIGCRYQLSLSSSSLFPPFCSFLRSSLVCGRYLVLLQCCFRITITLWCHHIHAVSIENILVIDVVLVLVWFWLYAYSTLGHAIRTSGLPRSRMASPCSHNLSSYGHFLT